MTTTQQLFSKIDANAHLQLSLVEHQLPAPKSHEVIVKMQAAPINPSDMWPMFGPADLSKAVLNDAPNKLALNAPLFPKTIASVTTRLGQRLPVGNEGAGTVISAGNSDAAQALIGKTVGVLSGSTYSQYCCVAAQACIVHNQSTTVAQAASSFVNPLTALAMVDTMRLENHSAIVHTAAASSLGQMLNKICIKENVPLVNIVRKQEQVDILREIGATHIINSSTDSYRKDLYKAINETAATLAFDATGGGDLANDILSTMEAVGSKETKGLNTYGSSEHKQVYLYGSLDRSPTVLNRAYGMSWGVGGWLLMQFLGRVGPSRVAELHKRVADEITSTFASQFTAELSLKDALDPSTAIKYNAKKTNEKYLINPSLPI